MSLLEVRGLRVSYGKRPILRNVSFEVGEGDLVGVLGANGCGKTTLLKAICGILPHAGECLLNGIALEGLKPRQIAALCGYIPQRSGVEIDLSVLDVVLMGFNPHLKLLEYPNERMKEEAREALIAVGLGGREEESYLSLSEGQKQLCILARTLVSRGRLLLLDEPESALDFRYRDRMLSMLRAWVGAEKRSALVVLHDPNLALRHCDRLLLLNDGEMIAAIEPARDDIVTMETALSGIYGEVSLCKCQDRAGRDHLVMLKE